MDSIHGAHSGVHKAALLQQECRCVYGQRSQSRRIRRALQEFTESVIQPSRARCQQLQLYFDGLDVREATDQGCCCGAIDLVLLLKHGCLE